MHSPYGWTDLKAKIEKDSQVQQVGQDKANDSKWSPLVDHVGADLTRDEDPILSTSSDTSRLGTSRNSNSSNNGDTTTSESEDK